MSRPGRRRVRELLDCIDNPMPDRYAGGLRNTTEQAAQTQGASDGSLVQLTQWAPVLVPAHRAREGRGFGAVQVASASSAGAFAPPSQAAKCPAPSTSIMVFGSRAAA